MSGEHEKNIRSDIFGRPNAIVEITLTDRGSYYLVEVDLPTQNDQKKTSIAAAQHSIVISKQTNKTGHRIK